MTRPVILRSDSQREYACTLIMGADKDSVVTIKGPQKSQSDEQRNLSFIWYADVGRQLDGWSAQDARAFSKLHIGVGLLRAHKEDFREQWDRLIRDRFSYAEKLDLMLEPHDYPVSRIMGVKLMRQYLDSMHRHWSGQGVSLTGPVARKYEGAA
ncbi:hypothetical protein [Dinoroseobacter sp. S375]|uniref:hypothetical protein n=1 Tax=Dinoroseobacter sp. S375 TaxID=3415136 RepID=UPI003C7CE24B